MSDSDGDSDDNEYSEYSVRSLGTDDTFSVEEEPTLSDLDFIDSRYNSEIEEEIQDCEDDDFVRRVDECNDRAELTEANILPRRRRNRNVRIVIPRHEVYDDNTSDSDYQPLMEELSASEQETDLSNLSNSDVEIL